MRDVCPWTGADLRKWASDTILCVAEGAFRFEYASDNGLAAGEVIEPDGSRVGAYQYKDPSGQLVKLKYRAGKQGFQVRPATAHCCSGGLMPSRRALYYYWQLLGSPTRLPSALVTGKLFR
ncbi:jg19046 [Pararge aegeria aegeria]|uniref:Jg19046 protein n=1 Tax=Pararge aegeria aegeria TaxID=348720 RepID=A0A8S4QZM4_9NEOP|nr:jg19046 [Pararge aegeria aegeria]